MSLLQFAQILCPLEHYQIGGIIIEAHLGHLACYRIELGVCEEFFDSMQRKYGRSRDNYT